MPQNLLNKMSTLVQVIAWRQQTYTWANADSDLCCHKHGVTRPQWVNVSCFIMISTLISKFQQIQNHTLLWWLQWINSSAPRAAYMHQWIGSALVQIMACRLFSTKPLSKPRLVYFQLDPQEQTSEKFLSKYKTFHSRKCIWKYRLRNGQQEMS